MVMALGAAGARASDAPPPTWRTLAACAAAYQVNARAADPDRSADMAKSMAGVADDYDKAAIRAYLGERKGAVTAARDAVRGHEAAKLRAFAGRPRKEVEAAIDACPQVEVE